MSLSATLFGRDSAIFKATNILGLGIPGWLDKKFGIKDTEGPRLSDLTVQTSTYGADIPRIYGTLAIAGNVIWLEKNKLKETVHKQKSGGKGGASTDPTKTYTYSATFALGLCEGEIAGVRRIWCADKLIYSAGSSDIDTIISNNKTQKVFKLYRGTDNQMPNSRYEADVGVGKAPAFRGLAYLVFYDFQLEAYSNTLQGAQFKVEVVKQATFLTTRTLNTYTVSPSLDESAGIVSINENVVSYCFDPTDLRPSFGDVSKYVTQRARTDGVVINQAPYSIIGGKPTGADRVVPIGKVGDLDAFYLWTLKGIESVVLRRNGFLVASHVTYPVDIDPTPGGYPELLGGHVNADGLYLFRRNLAGAWRYEFLADGVTVDSGGNLLNADGSPFTDALLIIASGIAPGDCPVVEVGGQSLWLIPSGGTTIRMFVRNDAGHFVYSESTNAIPSGNTSCGAAANGILALLRRDKMSVLTRQATTNIQSQSLQAIIKAEVTLSGLLAESDIDVSLISADIRGYHVSGGSIRSALEPLQIVAPFDVIQSGYKVKFIPRGQASVVTIPYEDLAAGNDGPEEDVLPQSREMDTQLPAKTTISYVDAAREYGISEQYAERINTPSVNKEEVELPIVLTADEAAKVAEVQTFGPWIERTTTKFNLPPKYLALEAADVVTISAPDSTFSVQITDLNYTQDARLEAESKATSAAIYLPGATGGEGVSPGDTIGLPGLTLLVPLDIPVIDETLQNTPGFVGVVAGYSDGWPGALLLRSSDNGQSWVDLQAFAGQATVGSAIGLLPASSCTVIDQRSLSVRFIAGAPESVTVDAMLSGSNYAAYGLDGRWEIVRFQNADLQSDGTYLISGFIRGDKGTEWASGLHATYDNFVLLQDPDNAFIGMPVESIGLPRLLKGVTSGNDLDSATSVPFTYKGVNLECLSPVYALGARDGSNNFSGTFTRRTRLSSSWWTTGVVGPVGETTESYEIDVMSGSTVKRTISSTTPAFSYSAAEQTTDFGSVQATITFRIYQLSSLVARGYPLEVIL